MISELLSGAKRPADDSPAAAGKPDTLVDRAWAWCERYRQRRDLLSLSDHMLKDIGISLADAEQEAAKRPWQP